MRIWKNFNLMFNQNYFFSKTKTFQTGERGYVKKQRFIEGYSKKKKIKSKKGDIKKDSELQESKKVYI